MRFSLSEYTKVDVSWGQWGSLQRSHRLASWLKWVAPLRRGWTGRGRGVLGEGWREKRGRKGKDEEREGRKRGSHEK